MTDSRTRTDPPAPDGSVVPGRIRIVGWILLTTALGLLAVVLTLRSSALASVEREANADVVQEVDEFRTFAAEGLDPQTGEPFDDAARLLELHLQRQFVDGNEVILGYVPTASGSPLIVQDLKDPVGLVDDPELVRELAEGDASSGLATSADGVPFRWGRAEVRPDPTAEATGVFLVAVSTEQARAEVGRQVVVVVLVCLAGLLLTAAIAWVVAGQILAPVRLVRRAAAGITRANLGDRIPVTGRDDVSALAATFNAMLDRLERAFAAQGRFAASASAHLRPPLALLRNRVDGDAEAMAAVRRMEDILEDLQVLADAEREDFTAARDVEVHQLLADVVTDVRRTAGGTHRVAVVEEAGGTAHVDPERVRQAVLRLARNAVREAPAGSTLTVAVRGTGDALELSVRDEGPGLTAEQVHRAFDRYDDAIPDPGSGRGPGLGLAVVRAVADAHGGSAWVESVLGAGATFGLTLPGLRPSPAVGRAGAQTGSEHAPVPQPPGEAVRT